MRDIINKNLEELPSKSDIMNPYASPKNRSYLERSISLEKTVRCRRVDDIFDRL